MRFMVLSCGRLGTWGTELGAVALGRCDAAVIAGGAITKSVNNCWCHYLLQKINLS